MSQRIRSSIAKAHQAALDVVRSMPHDTLRPSLQLPATLDVLVNRALKSPTSSNNPGHPETVSEPLQDTKAMQGSSPDEITATRTVKALSEIGGDVAFRQVNPVFSQIMMGGFPSIRLANLICWLVCHSQYPLSSRLMAPPADPLFYTRLAQGVHRATQGKARAWWKVFFQSKGQA